MRRTRSATGLAVGVLVLTACSASGAVAPAPAASPGRGAPPGAGPGPRPSGSSADPAPRDERVGRFGPPVRATVAAGCPRLTRIVDDVVPEGPPVLTALVPAGAPTAGLECRYREGRVDGRLLVGSRRLDAPAARRVAARLRAMPLVSKPRRVICLAVALPPGGTLVVLAYPGRADVNVWLTGSCPGSATNSWVRTQVEPG